LLSSNVNQRTDAYGGSIENRVRMPLEMLDAIIAEVGADKTSVRVNPRHTFNELVEDDVPELYAHYLEELQMRHLASPPRRAPVCQRQGARPRSLRYSALQLKHHDVRRL
jgi:2,4-dienoyl-CoA reductase-like NADH-dependent reductase (Old Yellow Enzyme family)